MINEHQSQGMQTSLPFSMAKNCLTSSANNFCCTSFKLILIFVFTCKLMSRPLNRAIYLNSLVFFFTCFFLWDCCNV